MQPNEFTRWLSGKFNGLTIERVFVEAGITSGEQGIQGLQGEQGLQGDPGADGEDGAFPPLNTLPLATTLDPTDLIYVLTDVAGTPTAKATTFANLVAEITAAQGA